MGSRLGRRVVHFANLPVKLLMPTSFNNITEIALKTIPSASKIEIKRVLESLYGFEVEKVQTLNMDGKKKKRGGLLIAQPSYKKAYVTLRSPLSISPDLFPIRTIEEDKKSLNKQSKSSIVEEGEVKSHWLDTKDKPNENSKSRWKPGKRQIARNPGRGDRGEGLKAVAKFPWSSMRSPRDRCTHFSFTGQPPQGQKSVSHVFGHSYAFHSSNRRSYSSTGRGIDHSFKPYCYPNIDARKLQNEFKKWPEGQRMEKLTASTFAGAIGYWPRRRVQLWREKLGIKESFPGSLATYWDASQEQEALKAYLQITGNSVSLKKPPVYHAIEKDWLAASPDGVIDIPYFPRGVLEIKCPFFSGEMSRTSPYRQVPVYYIPQAQGLMEILDLDWMHFYVWTKKGSSLFLLYRDVEYWELLKAALSDFWWKHVEPARSLIADRVSSVTELDRLRPAPRHELYNNIVNESHRVLQKTELVYRVVNGI